jgi:two-component system phosphate regulon sensor histidine kinase PhoR
MAATNADDGIERAGPSVTGLVQRLIAARWLIATLAFILLALYGAGLVTPSGGAIIFLAVVIVVALVLRAGPAGRIAAEGEAAAPRWRATDVQPFVEALPDPSFVLDRRGIVRYANQRALAAFPIRPGDPLAFRLRAPDLLAAFERVATGGAAERVEFAERVPTERWYAAWFARLDAADGGGLIALILDDLTERRRSDRIRVDFVANASHELRTPLASLVGFIETLQGPAREDAVARGKFLGIMHDQAARMSRLVDDLLSLSRIEMKAHLRPSGEADLADLVRHLADALEPLARDLGVAIETVLPETPVTITADRDELIQVFENLIENACKYGQTGKRVVVTVNAATAGAGASVSVRDFGPGIAEEHLPRLTERFYRVDVDASRQHRGTGLGLAIAKHILARHHARLTIASTLGEGALFTIVFPQEDASRPSGAPEIVKQVQSARLS